jgi:DNA-binding response OmpR family regulator
VPSILICDDDRLHATELAAGMVDLGWRVELVRSYGEAFAAACAIDFDALVVAPFLRDGSALALPSALGIRRPCVVVLACAMGERLAPAIVRRVGFDAQMTKVVDARAVAALARAVETPSLQGLTATKSR